MASYHSLIDGIVYGPVLSRRFGKTLGINLLPSGRKLCSFHCLYCQLGQGEKLGAVSTDFTSLEAVRKAWSEFNHHSFTKIGCVVVSGNGEPTLHPQFLSIIEELTKLRQKDLPKAKLICFTNGARILDPDVYQALGLFDECHLKLDARCHDIDLPEKEFSMTEVLEKAHGLGNLVIQSCFIAGRVSNMDELFLVEWQNLILKLKPKRIDIYTVSRPPAWDGALPVTRHELVSVANRLKSCGQNVRIA